MRRAKKHWTNEQESSKGWGNRLTPSQRGRRRRRTNYGRPVGPTLIRRGGTGRRDSKRPPKAAYQLPPAGGRDANQEFAYATLYCGFIHCCRFYSGIRVVHLCPGRVVVRPIEG